MVHSAYYILGYSLIFLYGIIFWICFWHSEFKFFYKYRRQDKSDYTKLCAWMIVLSPLWPILFLGWIFRYVHMPFVGVKNFISFYIKQLKTN